MLSNLAGSVSGMYAAMANVTQVVPDKETSWAASVPQHRHTAELLIEDI